MHFYLKRANNMKELIWGHNNRKKKGVGSMVRPKTIAQTISNLFEVLHKD